MGGLELFAFCLIFACLFGLACHRAGPRIQPRHAERAAPPERPPPTYAESVVVELE